MSWLTEFLHPGGAYKGAGQKEEEGYNQGVGFRQPYMDFGTGAGKSLQEIWDQLQNPGKLQDEWSQGYKESDYAKQLEAANTAQGMDQASELGLGGSSAALSNVQHGAGDIVAKDRQNYMNDLMQKYMAGIGIGTNMFNTGADTANKGAEGAQRHGEWQGQNTYNQQSAGRNQLMQLMSIMASAMGGGGGGGGKSNWNDPGSVPMGG
jgi:hypothetical protein